MALLKEDELLHPYYDAFEPPEREIPSLRHPIDGAVYLTDSANGTMHYQRHNRDWYNFPITCPQDHLYIHLKEGEKCHVTALSLFVGAQEIPLPIPATWSEQTHNSETALELTLPALPYGTKALLCICVQETSAPIYGDNPTSPHDVA